MSLINEALKKAQRQRSLDAAPLSSAPSGIAAAAVATHERSATHRHRSNAPVWFGCGLLVLGAVSTALIMRYGFAPATPVSASVPDAAAPVAAPAPVAVAAPAPVVSLAPESLVVLPPVAPIKPTPAARNPMAVVATPSAPDPVPVTPVAVARVAADHETGIQMFLAAARLTGVRGQDAQARVLMNEKVYRLNDIVESELGLRLSAVRPGLLVFTDAEGKTYEKSF